MDFFSTDSWPSIIPGIPIHGFSQAWIKSSILDHGWESADAECLLYALLCAILYKGLVHPGIMVPAGCGVCLGISPRNTEMTMVKILGCEKFYMEL